MTFIHQWAGGHYLPAYVEFHSQPPIAPFANQLNFPGQIWFTESNQALNCSRKDIAPKSEPFSQLLKLCQWHIFSNCSGLKSLSFSRSYLYCQWSSPSKLPLKYASCLSSHNTQFQHPVSRALSFYCCLWTLILRCLLPTHVWYTMLRLISWL